jgi:hypothetical protein
VIHAHLRPNGDILICGENCPIEPSARANVPVPVEILERVMDILSETSEHARLRDALWDLTIQARGKT